jgi:hypothetical protein
MSQPFPRLLNDRSTFQRFNDLARSTAPSSRGAVFHLGAAPAS